MYYPLNRYRLTDAVSTLFGTRAIGFIRLFGRLLGCALMTAILACFAFFLLVL